MSRLVDVTALLRRLTQKRTEYVASALDKADPGNAAYEYGYKVGFNRGLMSAEQEIEKLLKEEDDGRRSESGPKPGNPYQ